MNSITDASAENPYLIKIMPGTYNVPFPNALIVKDYVDIEGSGQTVTKITQASLGSCSLLSYNQVYHSELRDITIEQYSVVNYIAEPIAISVSTPTFSRVAVIARDAGDAVGINVYGSPTGAGLTMNDCSISCLNIGWKSTGIQSTIGSIILNRVSIYAGGIDYSYGIDLDYGSSLKVADGNIFGQRFGVWLDNWSSLLPNSAEIRNSVITGGLSSIRVDTQSSAYAANTQFVGMISYSGFVKTINCYDGNYDPLP